MERQRWRQKTELLGGDGYRLMAPFSTRREGKDNDKEPIRMAPVMSYSLVPRAPARHTGSYCLVVVVKH